MADVHGSSFMCKTGVSKAEYLVQCVRIGLVHVAREFCGVHIVSKMAQDVGMV